jgi:DNA-binding MarR family transcriptional regulator
MLRESGGFEAEATELIANLDRAMRQFVLAGEEGHEPPKRFRRSEIAVIDTLGAEGPAVMGRLARRVQLPLSTATRIIDQLVAKKIVQRERHEENRRVVYVKLAPAGARFYQAALRSRIAGAQRMLRGLSASERRELVRLVRKIADSVSTEPNA